MGQLEVAIEIAKASTIWTLLWLASGLWLDVYSLRLLLPGKVRWPIIAVGGMATHMILVLNLSYCGIAVRRGWWLALIISLFPLLFRLTALRKILATYRSCGPVFLFVVLGVVCQSWSLVREGVLTTSPAENGDWLTYVSHADILADFGYGYSGTQTQYPNHYIHTEQYETSNFRYGPSHLLASAQVTSGHRAIYVFNVFCGCLIGLVACGIFVFAHQLRISGKAAFFLGILWAVHPSVNWVSLAAFMPQIVGVTLMLTFMALSLLLVTGRRTVPVGLLLGLILCGLFVGYNELLPITVAGTGLSLLAAVRTNITRWKRMLVGVGMTLLVTIALSPLGVYRGVLGMILQIKIARSFGGSEQAVGEIVYFFGSWLGLLPLPPLDFVIATFASNPWHREVEAGVIVVLVLVFLLVLFGLMNCLRGRRVILPLTLLVGVCLGFYINSSFESTQYRTWALFKLSQYMLPLVGLIATIGVFSSTPRLLALRRAAGGLVAIAVLIQGFYFYKGFPKSPLTVNEPRYGMAPKKVDMDFVQALAKVAPSNGPVLVINDSKSGRSIPTSLLLYPRRVLGRPETSFSEAFKQRVQYVVEDRSLGGGESSPGVSVWQNERFTLSTLPQNKVYFTLAMPGERLLGPKSDAYIPSCKQGDTLAIHGYAVEGGQIEVLGRSSGSGHPAKMDIDPGEFIVQVPFSCGPTGAKIVLRTAARVFVADYEVATTVSRRSQLTGAADMLRDDTAPFFSLLPLIGDTLRWQKRQFDGSEIAPTVSTDDNGLLISSDKLTSGGVSAVVRLVPGWYEMAATGTVLTDIAGPGRGFGFGMISSGEHQIWQRGVGALTINQLFAVRDQRDHEFGVILGGFGKATGAGRLTSFELRRSTPKIAPSAVTEVAVPPFSDRSWAPVSYDGVKHQVDREVEGGRLSINSSRETSSGVGAIVELTAGTYILGGKVEASVPSIGSGLGYALLLEGQPESAISIKESGTMVGEKMFSLAKGGSYRLVAMIGGYGLSRGAARFSEVHLRRIGGSTGPAQRDKGQTLSRIPDLNAEGWKVVPLDASTGTLSQRKGAGWLGFSASGQVSSAAITRVKLSRGAYIIGADIIADASAVGKGKGYGFGFLNRPQDQLYVRDKGGHRLSALLVVDEPREDDLALIMGGFGTVAGSVRFGRPEIRQLRFSSLATIK